MIYLFLKPDEYLAAGRLAQLKAALGDPEMADLNTSELAGQISAADLLGQASMMPFLAARRLIIARGYLQRLDKRMAASKSSESAAHQEAAQLLEGLPTLPETVDVVFWEEAGVDKRRQLWKGFKLGEKGQQAARRVDGLQALIKAGVVSLEEWQTPDPKALPGWIQRQAKAKETPIEGRAVMMLANYVGPNLRQLDNELDKLAAYARGRAITAADVKLLVSDASEALIWDLTDGLSQRNGRKAMRALYELRRGDANPFYLLTMIARQYRIIIKVKEAMAQGMHNEYDIAKAVKESPYPVKKAMAQARAYDFPTLEQAMEQMLEADVAMKTGANSDTEIDLLVARLTR